jgi:hypothetical protein
MPRLLITCAIACVALAGCTKDIRDYKIGDTGGPDSTEVRERIKKELTAGEYALMIKATMRAGFSQDTTFKDKTIGEVLKEQEKIDKENGE